MDHKVESLRGSITRKRVGIEEWFGMKLLDSIQGTLDVLPVSYDIKLLTSALHWRWPRFWLKRVFRKHVEKETYSNNMERQSYPKILLQLQQNWKLFVSGTKYDSCERNSDWDDRFYNPYREICCSLLSALYSYWWDFQKSLAVAKMRGEIYINQKFYCLSEKGCNVARLGER